jgi:RNA polymerase sigma factor (sigma-70 family)
MAREQDERIVEVVTREQPRLRNFIRRRVPDPRDAEDILQDVFYRLVEANRLLMPIDHVTGWLFRVARNRIADLFRRKLPERFGAFTAGDEDDELLQLEFRLHSGSSGPSRIRHRMADRMADRVVERWERMTPEERDRFQATAPRTRHRRLWKRPRRPMIPV